MKSDEKLEVQKAYEAQAQCLIDLEKKRKDPRKINIHPYRITTKPTISLSSYSKPTISLSLYSKPDVKSLAIQFTKIAQKAQQNLYFLSFIKYNFFK